jgi:hypothetical protein
MSVERAHTFDCSRPTDIRQMSGSRCDRHFPRATAVASDACSLNLLLFRFTILYAEADGLWLEYLVSFSRFLNRVNPDLCSCSLDPGRNRRLRRNRGNNARVRRAARDQREYSESIGGGIEGMLSEGGTERGTRTHRTGRLISFPAAPGTAASADADTLSLMTHSI